MRETCPLPRPIPIMSQLFSPYQLGGLSLANRIVIAPMCQYSAQDLSLIHI